MKVLVACEFSGRVRDAFLKYGHDAISCDIIPSDSSGPHYQGDVRNILNDGWDMLIAFPPCTHLARSGSCWFNSSWNEKGVIKSQEQKDALNFVRDLLYAPIPRICIENPVGIISTWIRKPDQIIHPWQFGHGETKKTCLWLKNLPLLQPTNIVDGRHPRINNIGQSKQRKKSRSITYVGIAEAMAAQWGSFNTTVAVA